MEIIFYAWTIRLNKLLF